MDKIVEKKKRQVSGSRSKSRKSKPNEASLDMKPAKGVIASVSHDHSKNKTDQSINKSKGNKKNSKSNAKNKLAKGIKHTFEESKEISRSMSAERKQSLSKMNRTQANFEGQDLEKRIYAFKRIIKQIERPNSTRTKEILCFYRQIQDSISMVSQPLYSLLSCLHELYTEPINDILEMIKPYQNLLERKEELSREVEEKVKKNEQIFSKLSQQDLYIIKLKETIEQQRQLIQNNKQLQKKRSDTNKTHKFSSHMSEEVEMFKNQDLARNMKKSKNNAQAASLDKSQLSQYEKQKNRQKQLKSTMTFKENSKEEEAQRDSPNLGLKGAGLKLDLGGMNRQEAVGFHDQFYSKIDEFSESWRNQALREKRF